MADNQKDDRSGSSRLGQEKKGAATSSSAKNNPSGEVRGQNPGALHKGYTPSSGKMEDKDKDQGSRL